MGGMGMKPHHHHMMGMGMGGGMGMSKGMPEDASATDYLHIAKMAIKHHNKMMADNALQHAETRMLTRAVPAGSIAPDSSSSISAIEDARSAVKSGDMMKASSDIDTAMQGAQ